ncbi:hypothetical protein MtrunA17_Chr2g0312961 [Medicago truncatula]|uniref:Uncharacterized protein n=1 Tax=Medicago truncatula TaxID=3880 RepID=A0A396J8V1_MEDTR|nr:hypothetical protein MtrunA17_Chr2g0312961 [Medicago truncatula]
MTMKFTYGFWKNGPAQGFFLGQTVGFGEAARVTYGAVCEFNGVDHTVSVEEVVTGYWLVKWIGAVTEVNTVNVGWDFAGNWKRLGYRVFRYWGEVTGNLNTWVGGFG